MSAPMPNPVDTLGPSATSQAPHDLKGLMAYPLSLLDLWPWFLAAALASAIGLVILWYLKNRKPKAKPQVIEDPFLALERQLYHMVPPTPFEAKKGIQYYFDLNMLFRQIIEFCSGLPATDLTLQELKGPLRQKSILSRDTTEELLSFLERCESIKFAGLDTDLAEAENSHRQVKQWVTYLKPKQISDGNDNRT